MNILVRFRRVSFLRLGCDAFLILSIALFCAHSTMRPEQFSGNILSIISWIAITSLLLMIVYISMGVYEAIWRYFSFHDAFRLCGSILVSSLFLFPVHFLNSEFRPIASKYCLMNTTLLILMLGGARALRRLYDEQFSADRHKSDIRNATLIYGSGVNGRMLAKRFSTDSFLRADPVGFLDDDLKKIGHTICGLKVLGSYKKLGEILKSQQIHDLVISINDISGQTLSEVMQTARAHKVRVRMLSDLGLNDRTTSRFELFREVQLDDLLSRPSTRMNLDSVRDLIRGKRVLITGAGGSIGSELSRQVAGFEPSRLMLLDSSEFNLYTIDHELRTSTSDTSFIVPLLIDLRDRNSLKEAMEKYRPQIVFHAAAYKHVHLVELNPFSSVINNIEGTKNLLDFCQKIDVETFLLISTDKAVNPIGVMGSTKRVCEMMVADLGLKTGHRYCAVRFGNVVGSSGSLIPLLKKQIRAGGPVTITHEAMTRYFMLIREAVALVLKAASISEPGDISILRMGEPIRILDIAKNLITLLGKTLDEIPIVYTGLRPGEKLHEELYISGDELNTEHPDILVLPSGAGSERNREVFWNRIERLIYCAHQSRAEAMGILMEIVNPTNVKSKSKAPDLAELQV